MAVSSFASNGAPAAAIDNRTRHRIALRLLPFLFLLYIVNFLDRTSLAFGALGMSRDLGFSDRVIGLGVGAFFISYVVLQITCGRFLDRWSARRMISVTMVVWGLLTGLTALVRTPGQLYLARFALGVAEACFFPGVIILLSHWFVRADRAKAASNFLAAIPLSLVIGSPIAGWVLGRNWFAIQGWRWLFMLEGMPAVVLGILALFLLADRPSEAGWLTPVQQQAMEQKLEEERSPTLRPVTVAQTLCSAPTLLLAAVDFLSFFVFYSVAFWLPTLLKRQSGLSDWHVGLLGAVPYAVGLIAMVFSGWHSDRRRERVWHVAVPLFIAAGGLLGLVCLPSSTALTVVLLSVVCVELGFNPVFWAIPTEILSGPAAAAAVGMICGVSSVAGFTGPYAFAYLNSVTGSMRYGFALMMVSLLAGGVLILLVPGVRLRSGH